MSRLNVAKEFSTRPFHVSYMAQAIKDLCEAGHPSALKRLETFWTLGSASYKDKEGMAQHEYDQFVTKHNFFLVDTFAEFYRFQLEYFSDLLKKEVRYLKNVSIPGFHCFKYHPTFTKPLARPHVDVPFNQFDWGKKVGYNTIFTHVVPLTMPLGGGMYVWDVTAEDIDGYGVEEILRRLPEIEPQDTVHHKVDQMVFHSGRFVHQIKPFEYGQDDEWRITLQSHAVMMDNVWNLYW